MRSSSALALCALSIGWIGAAEDAAAQRAPVETVRFFADSVAREMTYNIILPSGYGDEANRERQYPTLYLLHGYGNNYQGWARFMGVPRYAPEYDLIIVMPDAGRREFVLRQLDADGWRRGERLGELHHAGSHRSRRSQLSGDGGAKRTRRYGLFDGRVWGADDRPAKPGALCIDRESVGSPRIRAPRCPAPG